MGAKRSRIAGLALAGVGALSLAALMSTTAVRANETSPKADTAAASTLGHYDSTTRDFWLHPPDDWWRGDETEAQRGLVPNPGQPLPSSAADLDKMLAAIKLPPGFKISVWQANVPQARQMAWG